MDEEELRNEIRCNIVACLVSAKDPTPIWILARDYETIVGTPIPFRQFKYSTLEDFLKSFPTLRVNGTGKQAMVVVQSNTNSSHVSDLIARQKPSSKRFAPPSRKSLPSSYSNRPRGGYRGRGRGTYPFRSFPPRDTTRDYTPRDWENRNYNDQPARDYAGGDYNHNSVPKRYSPAQHNSQDSNQQGAPLTVKVEGDDKRQVSWKKPELPPRLQKKQSAVAQQSGDIPQSPVIPGSKGFDSPLFLDQSETSVNSASIISPLGPSQLVERAKRRAEKSKLEQNYGTSDFLLQPSPSQEMNGLTAGFAQLNHQNSNGTYPGSNSLHSSSNRRNQISEVLSLSLQPQRDLLPEPDERNLANNVDILQRFCLSRGWAPPTYSVIASPISLGVYFSKVKVNGDDANSFQVSSLPEEHADTNIIKGAAAKKALMRILAEEEKKVKANKIISSDTNSICSRIGDIVSTTLGGMFATKVEDEYIQRFGEMLPDDWMQRVSTWPTLCVEETVNGHIVVAKVAPTVHEAPEEVQFDPTVAPPSLDIQAIGSSPDQTEDVFVTHATSVNNVWFRVIGTDYSDEYALLVEQMDLYYKNVGEKDLALSLEVDQYYAAYELNTWWRVRVTEVDESSKTVTAWLCDHGDTVNFQFGSLYRLAPQFCHLPQQAVLCALEGLDILNDDELANEIISTSDLLIGKALIAKITFKSKDPAFVRAFLYDTSGEEDCEVNEQIQDEIVAKSKPVLRGEGNACEVAIGDVSRKGEVYVTINKPAINRICEICEALTPDVISQLKVKSYKHISLNKMYLAKYSRDENWYRAVVTDTPSVQKDKIPVRFIDYGNTESVGISDIADLDNLPENLRILKKLPAQAVKVALHNLPTEELTNPQIASLHSLLLDEEKVVLMKTISLKVDPPIVEIFTRERNMMVSVNTTIQYQKTLFDESNDGKNSVDSPGLDGTLNPATNNKDKLVLQRPDLSGEEFQPILVVLAANPGNFIFQLRKYIEEDLKTLKGKMNAYYESGALPAVTENRILKNQLFAARYVDEWYRVLVTDKPMGNRVPVRLSDFGDIVFVPTCELRELAPEFRIDPFFAVKGKLAGVMPVNKDWSVQDCIRFQDLVVNKVLAAKFLNIDSNNDNVLDMVVEVKLVDTSTSEDKDIAEILIKEQRAVRES